jgi:hypothetical protein
MSKALYFGNNGAFDIRAMLTFGVSAKENADAIGYFGTGFKYAVAIILRLGGAITVRTGAETLVFTASRETIRGKDFDIVKCNGIDAGFTTRLGINWQPWQAFRELWCNAKDEGGECGTEPMTCDTVVEVNCEEIARAYQNREQFFIDGEPAIAHESCEIYNKPSQYIFYRGVAVRDTGKAALLSYNIRDKIDLTEDRTAAYSYQIDSAIRRSVQSMSDGKMLRRIITAPRDSYEHDMNFYEHNATSAEFVDNVRQLIACGIDCNESARQVVAKLDDKAGNWPEVDLSSVQHKMLERARAVLKRVDIDTELFPLRIVNGLGEGVMGRAIEGTMYLSLLPFNMGTKQVASTIMEEWVHCKHGVADFDRNMQNWLFDKILSLAEEITGEPI